MVRSLVLEYSTGIDKRNARMVQRNPDEKPIEFIAEIHKVGNLVDGTIRVTLDLSEHETVIAAQLLEIRRVAGVAKFEVSQSD
jgi:hypothetical protein